MEDNRHLLHGLTIANPKESEQGHSMHLYTTAFCLRQVSIMHHEALVLGVLQS